MPVNQVPVNRARTKPAVKTKAGKGTRKEIWSRTNHANVCILVLQRTENHWKRIVSRHNTKLFLETQLATLYALVEVTMSIMNATKVAIAEHSGATRLIVTPFSAYILAKIYGRNPTFLKPRNLGTVSADFANKVLRPNKHFRYTICT